MVVFVYVPSVADWTFQDSCNKIFHPTCFPDEVALPCLSLRGEIYVLSPWIWVACDAEEETLCNVEARLYKVMQLPPGLF